MQDSSAEDPVEELVFAYLERTEGEPSSSASVLDELCASAPTHASELRKRVAALVGGGLWQPSNGAETPRQIGDFRIVERLGQGGMGVVFLAEQASVSRRVALKVVRAEQLVLGNVRARFLREAQAVARLDHPGIVRVLTAGESGGVPYIAMEYVEGCSLDSLIADLAGRDPAQLSGADVRAVLLRRLGERASNVEWNEEFFARGWTELCVRMTQSLAEALQHAHQRGVLHRDIKPSNVLLAPDGRVKLCDFGLAALADSAKLTGSGAQLGTLAYMAPEQFRGDAAKVTQATDVYALGLTLYELLALRHPFVEPGQGAVKMATLDTDAAPLRSRNRSVPADVEVICAKALERDSARRYPGAGDLARDLGNVLALRPIEARPPTLARRARRWTQRHPAASVGIALGGLLALAGPIGWELSRMRSMEEVRSAYEQSERDFRAALSAIGHVLRDTATEELADVPRMQRARLVALDRALALYASLSEDRRTDVEVLAEGAELHASRAEVLADLGRTEESHAEYERALRFREQVHQLVPTPAHAVKLAAAKVAFGKSFTALFDMEAGLPHIEQGLELWRAQKIDGESSEWANAQLALAEARFLIGRNEGAREAAEEARDLARSMQLARPDAPGPFWTLGRAEGWLSAIAERASEHELAREHGQASLAGFERASSLAPEERFYSFEIAEAQCDLADPLFELGELDAARSMLDSALARVDALLRDFPDSRRYRNLRSATLENLAVHAGRLGDPERALALQRDIVAERERDHRTLPERRDIAIRAAISQINLGASLSGLGHDLPAALAAYERAEALLAAWSTDMTGENEVSRPYVMARYGRALTLLRTGALDEAQRAIEAHSELVGDSAERLRYSADLWNELANAQAAAGHDNAHSVERLFELLGAAVERGYADRNELESTPALDAFRADARFRAILARVPSD